MRYAAVADPDGKGVDLYTGLTRRLREEYR
jgi:hypothetical protein